MAKRTVWDLALEIAGKDKGATEALKTVKKQIENVQAAAKQLGTDWKGFTQNATKLVAGVVGGTAAVGAAIVGMANSVANTGAEVAKTAAAIGIGTEAYQGLQYAMGQSSVSAEEFDTALKKMSQTIKLGAAGNAAARRQLESIGLSASKLAGMKPEDALMRLSDYLKSLPSDAARTQASIVLFGKQAGPQMAAALSQGSESITDLMKKAQSLGIVLSDDVVQQSATYKNAQADLFASVNGLKNQFITGAIGPLTEAFKILTDAVSANMPAIQELGKTFGTWLGDTVKRLPEVIAKAREFGTWVKDTVIKVKDFVGGWKNLGMILGGLAVAPTLLSGLKVAWSFGKLITTTMKAWPIILSKFSLGFGPVMSAALPIIGVIVGIAAAAYLIIKNWDKVKPAIVKAFNGIKETVGNVINALNAWWEKHGDGVMAVVSGIASIITTVFSVAWNILSTAISVTAGIIGGFIGLVSDCVGWLSEHKTVLGAVAIIFGTLTAAIVAYNAAQAIANAGGLVAVVRMGAQAVASGALSVATGVWSTVAGIGTAATTAFGAAMAFLTSPITLVILAIGAVIAAAYLIIKNWDTVSAFFINLWEGIKNIFSGIGNWFKEKFTAAKEAATGAFANVSGFFRNTWGGIQGAFSGVGGWFAEKFGGAREAMKGAFTGVQDWVKNNWKSIALFIINPFAGVFKYLYDNFEGFRNVVNNVVSAVKGFFQRGIEFIKNVINGLPEPFRSVFGFIGGIIDAFMGFWKNVFGAGITAIKNIVAILPNIFSDPIGTVKAIVGEVATFFKTVFQSAVDAVKGIINGFAGIFGGVFDAIKEKVESFVNFFKDKMGAVKNFFGGIGDTIGGLFGKGKAEAIPAHAAGGVFTQPHIAQIAEKGAEAVVPLDKSSQGLDIWKKAGQLGGYLQKGDAQTATGAVSSPQITQIINQMANVKTATGALNIPQVSQAAREIADRPEAFRPRQSPGLMPESPLMAAAAQKISRNNNFAIDVNFTQNVTINGNADSEAVKQISQAGRQASDDIKTQVQEIVQEMMEDERRHSYA